MKYSKLLFILLTIYSSYFSEIQAQEYTLKLQAENAISRGLKDSLKIKKSYANKEAVLNKIDTIHKTLQQIGYIDTELKQINIKNDTAYTANFYLGKKYKYLRIYYSEQDFSQRELKQVATEVEGNYFTIPITSFPSAMRKLTAIRNQQGNAFARIKATKFEKDENNELTATLYLNNGNQRTIDSIAIKGYERFPRSYLKYYAGIKKGKIFNKKKLVEQSENLNSLGFVSATKPPEALFRKDSTIVYFYLEKQNNNQFDGILGFATDEETQKLEFNGYLNLELNNNLHFGEQFLLNYRADGKEQIQFRTKVTLPYLFRTPFGLSGELKIFKRDSSFVTTEQQLRTTYQINPASQSYVGYRSFDSSNLLDQTMAGIPIEDFKSSFIIGGISYLKYQNHSMFPIKTKLSLDIGAGSRVRNGNSERQQQAEVSLSNIFKLNLKNSIFTQTTTNALFSDTYLVNELFRFGGINSIRGFDENSIDASLFSVINTEYRYQFNKTMFAHSIIDIGYFENETLDLKQKLYSFGLGLGITTKAGLFRFIAATGSTEEQNLNVSNIKIHISLSSRF
ncbi:POTRA domain-containing protein [Aequorivita viscosa]|uniref:Outer membrane protein assembly factor BamA n=1 Tax=Aequorivita viscosa TaxID=797419 RepID=A0A1M6CVX3_9FLAO|nr:POTRA domain-containing protein [Aequorivita viscosa]SDW41329.1 Outer membrane protein assembly factor BamA [Aequorivita viscosa]SHI65033.1 Outer membrane protein assembly factor BamA [Aequorivita viscosa]